MSLLQGIVAWAGICVPEGPTWPLSRLFCLLGSAEKSGVIPLGLPFYVILSFPLPTFDILSLFCALSVLIIPERIFFFLVFYRLFVHLWLFLSLG